MMKSTVRLLIAMLALAALAYGQEQPTSRFGTIEIDDSEDRFTHRLILNGKKVLEYEGLSVDVYTVLQGSGVDYLIVETNSGGIGCPFQVVIVELYKSGEARVGEPFGSCGEPDTARLIRGRVIVEMGLYTAHPDLLSKKELRRRERMKDVYTWYQGELTKKTVPNR